MFNEETYRLRFKDVFYYADNSLESYGYFPYTKWDTKESVCNFFLPDMRGKTLEHKIKFSTTVSVLDLAQHRALSHQLYNPYEYNYIKEL